MKKSKKSSLIGKKVLWKDKEYTIIDVHNSSDFIIIDNDYRSIISLEWENVKTLN